MSSPFNGNGGGLSLWNKLEVTDPAYTKKFDKGNFKGTAVDAVWNIKRVTEQLGPVGFAWGWHIVKDELVKFDAGEEPTWIHNCVVRAWFKQPDGSTREVEHVGSTIAARFVGRDRGKRFMVDDEYAKKSVTDALSKIMVSLGTSADIWLGRFDGNKYTPPQADEVDDPLADVAPAKEQPRQTRQPPKPQIVPGEPPEAAVERANARMADRDPWKLDGTPTEHLLDTLKTAIAHKPWAEVEQLTPYYSERLKLTDHEKGEIRKAWVARRKAETPITAVG